jgi:hypothetical protein
MKNTARYVYFKLVLAALLLHSGMLVRAQMSASLPFKISKGDTIQYFPAVENKEQTTASVTSSYFSIYDDDDDNSLQKTVSLNLSKSEERKQLMNYLKQLELGNSITENQKNSKALYRFANLFARLKMYPLAMKCFFKTIDRENRKAKKAGQPIADADDEATFNDLPINTKDESLLGMQAEKVKHAKNKYTNYRRIVSTFNDGKPAVAYALLFHVKQPISGKPKVFVFSNTGHTFITLIKYNADSTYVSCSFGFYPKKEKILFATPWDPDAESQFKDDAGHKWDEVVGKFISKRSFEKILGLTKKYEDLDYHLSNNNCTDFSLKAATLAGLNISDTKASWPLGYGSNPGTTGQSVMDGKFNNTDSQPNATIFKATDIAPSVK